MYNAEIMGISFTRVVASAALVFSCLTVAPAAWADESAAETYFQEGISAMKRSDFTVACDAFAKSNKADPSPGTQINLALCYEKQKKWASAWTWYRSAFGLAQQRGQKEREQLADDSANRLKPQLHYVVVSVTEPLADLVVRRDGNEVATTLGGKDVPLPIDPGEHTLEVSAKGKKTWTHKFVAADNANTDKIEVPKLEDEALPSSSTPTARGDSPPVIITSEGNGQRVAGIIVGAAGLLSGVGSLIFFVLAQDQAGERDERAALAQAPTTPEELRPGYAQAARNFHDAAKMDELIAFSMLGGAAVLIGTGAVLYLTAPKPGTKTVGSSPRLPAPKKASAHLVPMVGPIVTGLGVGGTF